ncbi:FAD:protein FMN transferase [soil metagenome]
MPPVVATFAALGCHVHVAVREPGDLPEAERLAQVVLRDVDEVASRFRPDSDLVRVNRLAGEWVAVDPLLLAGVAVACRAAAATDGLVNPLLGRAMVSLGYDRDFSLLRELEADDEVGMGAMPDRDAWRTIETDPGGAIRIPAGTALDLGATGKAWASDLVAAAHEEHLSAASLVSVGGDLRISAPDGTAWPVAVAERPGARPACVVTLTSGAMATSTTRVRRWARGGVRRHHLLDPRSGQPAREVWRTVTATGPTCSAANTASTAAVVLGAEAVEWLETHSVTARLVASGGGVRRTGTWPADEDAA